MGGAAWRDLIRDQMAVRAAEVRETSGGASHAMAISRVGFARAVQPYLVLAAQRRGISIAGYIRRATMAVVAMDLGIDPVEIFEQDMAIAPLGKGGMHSSKDLDGELYGRWEVRPDEPHGAD